MGRITTYFGLENAKPEVIRLSKIYTTLSTLMQIAFVISTTFYLIFVAEALGNNDYIVGMTYVGILVIISMVVQTLFDYPTGVIGDWLGQRYIIATAFVTYAVAFYLVSLVTTASPFLLLVIIYALMGFAGSQQSGALGSWFDSNWKVAMVEDEGRKQYGVFLGKLGMIGWLTNTLILIPGGLLATIFGRPWVFQFQAILCIIIAFASLKLVKNLPETDELTQTRPTMDEYFSLLREGLQYLFTSQYVKYLILGSMLVNSCIAVWANLILFPMYYSYLLTDVAVASFRTIVMIPLVFYAERSGVWAKKYEPKKWIPRFRLFQSAGAVFFWIFALIMILFPIPPPTSPMIDYTLPGTDILILRVPIDSILPVALMILVFFVLGIFFQLAGVLTSRVFVDAIPNRVRNGVYSLFPTIVLLMSIPQIAFFGWLLSVAPISLTLVLCGIISTTGVLIIHKGLQYPHPSEMENNLSETQDDEDDMLDIQSEDSEI
ncbi:MAG: MFS transporter [Candidatus Thorarchaeota archaeon]|nr:MFS transporter [Candidatus Thorarchaeota archaeon]